MVYNEHDRYWMDPDGEEFPDSSFTNWTNGNWTIGNWTNETQTYIDKVRKQFLNLEKSTSIMNASAVIARYHESIKRRHVIMGKDGKWIAVDDSFTKNSEAERYVVCESTDKYQRLIVNG